MSGNGLNFATRPETLRKAVAATRTCSLCGREVRASMLVPHENRHRVEQETKPCAWCGAEIRRNSRDGQRLWDQKRFCSNACHGRWAARNRSTPLTECYAVMPSGCWEWTRRIDARGYGSARNRNKRGTTSAHRMVWTELRDPIPDGMTLDHLCRNTRCVNPDHLEPVTAAENNRRAAATRSQCPSGHPYDGIRNGHRSCSECHRQEQRRYVARQSEETHVL